MTAIETLAVIVAVLTLVKIATLIINPKIWMALVDLIYRNKSVSSVIYVIIILISGYYVLQSVSIIDIGAVTLFIVFLMGLGFFPYYETILKLRDDVVKTGIKKAWLSLVIWTVFALWILYAVLV
ncbi:MAG: hypothetical protein ABIC36_02410 [bacterium]